MGTYVGYYGDMTVPKEKQPEFTERVLKILHQGGMMQLETVTRFGKRLSLLFPAEADQEGMVHCTYNYFEDDHWETATYNKNSAKIASNKVGTNEFNAVICAVHVLYEFYTEKFGLAWENETPFNAASYIQWLNYLFRESYTNERAVDLWEIYQLLPPHRKRADLFQLLDMDEFSAISVTGALKYIVLTGAKSLEQLAESMSDEVPENEVTLLGCIKALLNVLKRIRESGEGGHREKLETLKRVLTEADLKNCQESKWTDYRLVNLLSMLLPREITVKHIADTFEVEYEKTMEEFGPLIHDKSELWNQGRTPMKPLTPLNTTSFLMQVHRGAAKAVSDDTAYRITDDDRAYYWREDGDVRFSERMWTWLRDLRREWEMIQMENTNLDTARLRELWFCTLYEAAQVYAEVYCFGDTFYEFVVRANEPQIQAAVILLERMVNRTRSNLDEDSERDTWLYRRKRLESPERLEIKRYLAVLGNLDLRKEVFGF